MAEKLCQPHRCRYHLKRPSTFHSYPGTCHSKAFLWPKTEEESAVLRAQGENQDTPARADRSQDQDRSAKNRLLYAVESSTAAWAAGPSQPGLFRYPTSRLNRLA